MPEKPQECKCGWLGLELNDEGAVVKYDTEMERLYIDANGKEVILRFCPSCGGAFGLDEGNWEVPLAPSNERRRVERLTDQVRTPVDAIQYLGTPSYEGNMSDGVSPPVAYLLEFYELSLWFDLKLSFDNSNMVFKQIAPKPMNLVRKRKS